MRLGLAIRSFIAVLFRKPLPAEVVPEPMLLPAPPEPPPPVVVKPPPVPSAPVQPAPVDAAAALQTAAVAVLAVLQAEGRLLDFLSEDIEGYGDADIGAAVRDIHRGLRQAVKDHFPVSPIRSEDEESPITVPVGFNPGELRLVGNVVGEPPFAGVLKHKGWRVDKVQLPRLPEGAAARVAAPAEVEI